MAIENQITPFKVASAVGGSVFLSSDKTHSLAPNNARYLAQQLVMAADRAESGFTETDLLVPFNQNGITQLNHKRFLYEQQYSIKFTDLGDFVSHVVSKQLYEMSYG